MAQAAKKKEKEQKEQETGLEEATVEAEIGSLREQLRRTAERIAESRKRIDKYDEDIAAVKQVMQEVQGRIDRGPSVAEALENLSRGYSVLKESYEKTQSKWLDANMAANLERTQRGEQFEVVEPAQKTGPALSARCQKGAACLICGSLGPGGGNSIRLPLH